MLTSVFGLSIKYEAWNHQASLPVYIAGSYDFHTAYIGNRRCIIDVYKRQVQYCLDEHRTYSTKNLVEYRANDRF